MDESNPYYPARPTIYKGIAMRSRLEAKFAQYCDQKNFEWHYEPQCFADETGQYLPDFYVRLGRRGWVYVELKGAISDPEYWMRRMEIIWSSEPNATLVLGVGPDCWHTLDDGWHYSSAGVMNDGPLVRPR